MGKKEVGKTVNIRIESKDWKENDEWYFYQGFAYHYGIDSLLLCDNPKHYVYVYHFSDLLNNTIDRQRGRWPVRKR